MRTLVFRGVREAIAGRRDVERVLAADEQAGILHPRVEREGAGKRSDSRLSRRRVRPGALAARPATARTNDLADEQHTEFAGAFGARDIRRIAA